ncbi:MAG: hypothetical protein Ct9H300mP22_1250 [Gammaproteobacteria bacterium]|nr:MAG: hypothetical protein Ct9H300mP22_1250 [Gammaproteobacteria bacterium]
MGDGALTKADMAERLFEELGLNKREAKEVVEQFFEEIRESLERNEQVKLSGYGILTLGTRNNALVEIQKPVKKSQLRPDV